MKILAIVHEADAGPGVFGEVTRARGDVLHEWLIAEGGRCPESPQAYDAVLALGGAMHAHEYARHPWLCDEQSLLRDLVQAGRPVLGVCLGAQVLARAGGGETGLMPEPEIGWYDVRLSVEGHADPLVGPLGARFRALQWHSCRFSGLPGATPLATSEACLQAYRIGELAWGIQFHAEVTLADFEAWLDYHLANPQDGHRAEDPEALRASTRAAIDDWNALGRRLFGRFLERVEAVLGATP